MSDRVIYNNLLGDGYSGFFDWLNEIEMSLLAEILPVGYTPSPDTEHHYVKKYKESARLGHAGSTFFARLDPQNKSRLVFYYNINVKEKNDEYVKLIRVD